MLTWQIVRAKLARHMLRLCRLLWISRIIQFGLRPCRRHLCAWGGLAHHIRGMHLVKTCILELMVRSPHMTHGSARLGAQLEAQSIGNLEVIAWSEDTEVDTIQSMDIGVMPLPDTPWARGKCGYKLIQYMACSLPVIASPVGVNKEIVEHGINGFLAETHDEWVKALNTLLGDADLRQRMGAAGRAKVEREYSLQVYGPKVANLLSGVLEANVGKVR